MRVVICGCGEVGERTAERLVEMKASVTVLDREARAVNALADRLDVEGHTADATRADALREAGVHEAGLLVAATHEDIVNLAIGRLAKEMGCRRVVARVHDARILRATGVDYAKTFGADVIVCPELVAAHAVARAVHNPAAVTLDLYARGRAVLGEYDVAPDSAIAGQSLAELRLPRSARIVAMHRDKRSIIPDGATVLEPRDLVVVVADDDGHAAIGKLFSRARRTPGGIGLVAGSRAAASIARQLLALGADLRVFSRDAEESKTLATELPEATVLDADPTDEQVFANESLEKCAAMVLATDDEEFNLLAAAWTRAMGVPRTIALTKGVKYEHLFPRLGVSLALNPAQVAARQICLEAEPGDLRRVASFFDDQVAIYEIPVGPGAAGKPMKELRRAGSFIVALLIRGKEFVIPAGDDAPEAGDTALVAAAPTDERMLKRVWLTRGGP